MEHPIYQHRSSLSGDGRRIKIRPADVSGIFNTAKRWVYALLLIVFVTVPWVRYKGHPLVLFDIEHRQFFLFGQTFNSQDFYLVFFLLTGGAFSLFFITAVFGRVWCGWACPQTVFLEAVFRRIERWIEGPRTEQLHLAESTWNVKKIKKFVIKHLLFAACAVFVAALFLSLFNSTDRLVDLFKNGPATHPILMIWLVVMSGVIYINFSWFREQLCLIVCPYGRFQSVLTDDDSLVIGYDKKRGEPRGKKNDPGRGACIDCGRCVAVCPTGIDIRVGLQMECIGCANCIDACNDIMVKIQQPQGLIRYDSYNGLEGKKKRIMRPRLYLYTVLLFIGAAVFSLFAFDRQPFEANLLRLPGIPYRLENKKVINQFEIHLVNKEPQAATFEIIPLPVPEVDFILPISEITLESLQDRRIPLFVEIEADELHHEFLISVQIREKNHPNVIEKQAPFLGPTTNAPTDNDHH